MDLLELSLRKGMLFFLLLINSKKKNLKIAVILLLEQGMNKKLQILEDEDKLLYQM